MTRRRAREIIEYGNEVESYLYNTPVRLRDVRDAMTDIEVFAEPHIMKRSALGMISRIVISYYPLPEFLALHRRQQEVYQAHLRANDFDGSNYKNVVISEAHDLCSRWLDRYERYPYGDVRLLRPIIEEVLTESATWPESPYPEQSARLEQWYEALASGGALYPSDEHLAYVQRFEAFAEDIVWDSRDRDYITIVNFPAPANALPPKQWWHTQHVLPA